MKEKSKAKRNQGKQKNILGMAEATLVNDGETFLEQLPQPVSNGMLEALQGIIVADPNIPNEPFKLTTWIPFDEIILEGKKEPSYEALMAKIKEKLTGTIANTETGLLWYGKEDGSHMLIKSSSVLRFVMSQSRAANLLLVRLSVKPQIPDIDVARMSLMEIAFNETVEASVTSLIKKGELNKDAEPETSYNPQSSKNPSSAKSDSSCSGSQRPRESSPVNIHQSVEDDTENQPMRNLGPSLGGPQLPYSQEFIALASLAICI